MQRWTWHTLLEYLEQRIASHRLLLAEVSAEHDDVTFLRLNQGLQRQLNESEWLVPLIQEFVKHPTVQALQPILSMQTVRLLHGPRAEQEFVWIEPVDAGHYRLVGVKYRGLLDYDRKPLYTGTLKEVVNTVEYLTELASPSRKP